MIAAVVSHGGDVTPLAALAGAGFAAVVLAAIMTVWLMRMGRARPAGFDLVLSTGERIPMCTAHIAMKAGVYDRDLVVERITPFIPGR